MNDILLTDPAAERAVLSGIYNHGRDAYFDVADIVDETTFTVASNSVIYKCFKHILENTENGKLDIPSVLSSASELGLSQIFDKTEELRHLNAIIKFPVNIENVRKFGAKIRKLQVARLLNVQLEQAQDKIKSLNGDETLSHILGIAEDTIFDFSSLLGDGADAPELLGSDIEDYIKYLEENPCDSMGFSTGYPVYDSAIGGGLRRGTVNVIGARPKTGKTLLADNIGCHIASNLDIPVLNLDTEMTLEDHRHRTLAMLSEVSINDVETGSFSETPDKKNKIYKAAKEIKEMPYFHRSIGGMPFEEQLSVMRRWLAKEVGFMMTGLHNFSLRYKVPILAFIQLNRDGITRESTDAASGSDRIIWLCSNFTIFKRKSDEEMAEDGVGNGNRKLVPIVARHGSGMDDGDYINMHMKGWCGKIDEGKTASELRTESSEGEEGFIVEDDEEEIPFQ